MLRNSPQTMSISISRSSALSSPAPSGPLGVLAELWVYPIKSCAGLRVPSATLLATGLQWDRHWMLVDDKGRFVTQRTVPRMALLRTALTDTELVVQPPALAAATAPPLRVPLYPDTAAQSAMVRRPVQVWKSALTALDEGPQAAQWFSAALGVSVALVRFDDAERRLCNAEWTGEHAAHTEFSDGFPLLVTTASSMDGLNSRLRAAGETPVDMRRFRANLVLSGYGPHAEDHMHRIDLNDGTVQLKPIKPCTRCPMPDVNPDTAATGHGVRTALKAYRADAQLNGALTFGQNAIVLAGEGAVLREGMGVLAQMA